jgi:hypothetical protein
MNKEQMDEFLQSIGGLKNGFKLESNPITDAYYFEVKSGWYPLIKDLITDLINLGWNKEITQVKEKFGTLRLYINEGTDDIHRRIANAENESNIICEVTGQPGKLRNDLPWWKTLCDEEYFKIKNKQ